MSERTDDELIRGYQQGQSDCFTELVYRYKNSLYQYILALVHDEGAADDIFQEVFLSFHARLPQYQPQGKLKSYLFTAARNRVLNFFRDKSPNVSLDEPDEEGNAFWHEQLESAEKTPLAQLEQQDMAQQIARAAETLPPHQREVIFLKQYMSFKEIAEMLQRPLGTVLAAHHRGIQKMQQFLQSEENV